MPCLCTSLGAKPPLSTGTSFSVPNSSYGKVLQRNRYEGCREAYLPLSNNTECPLCRDGNIPHVGQTIDSHLMIVSRCVLLDYKGSTFLLKRLLNNAIYHIILL